MIVTEETVEFDSLDDLIIFTRYNSKNTKSVSPGYVLKEDLVNNKGGILYAKDTEIDATKISRLTKIIDNNPEIKPHFILIRSEKLVEIEREMIYAGLMRMIDTKKSRMEFSRMMKTNLNALEARWKRMLLNGDVVLYLSQLKFFEDKVKKSKINPFYNHMLNTTIFAMGIMVAMKQVDPKKIFNALDMADLVSISLLHGARGWETCGQFIERPIEERKTGYIEANKGNMNYLKKFDLDDDIFDAVDYVYQFSTGEREFLEVESRAVDLAAIVSIASFFDETISGMWKDSKSPREVVDQFYVMASEKKLPKEFVDALAKGLKFSNLFDFYHELEILLSACARKAGRAYPMTGFKSPIIFVCENNYIECREIVASAKSITVFKETGGLAEGSYGRCEGLSSKLQAFYEEHYHEIKEDVLEKQGVTKKDGEMDSDASAPAPSTDQEDSANGDKKPEGKEENLAK